MRFFPKWLLGLIIVILIGLGIFGLVQKPETVTPIIISSSKEVVGTSVQSRPIEAFIFGAGTTTLLFVGGIHGGYEWNSVLLAYKFIDYFTANPTEIPDSLKVVIIPSANPDGVYKVIGKSGRFTLADVPTTGSQSLGRFNANSVDLNRNFDCNWQATSTWQSKTVSAGTSAFSEPEAQAIRNVVTKYKPSAVVFWHSQSNAVYASECNNGILPVTLDIMNAYAKAASYPVVKSFDSYKITGDAEGWLASIKIPAITVELKTHETIEWDKNLAGVMAVLKYYSYE